MNYCFPDWNFQTDLPATNQKKAMGPEHELVELLWRDGQVILHSQNHRKQNLLPRSEVKELPNHGHPCYQGSGSYVNPSNLIQDDETVSWIHDPVEDSFEKEFCSNFFSDLPLSDPVEVVKSIKHFEDDRLLKFGPPDVTNAAWNTQQINNKRSLELPSSPMPPPKIQSPDSSLQNHDLGVLGKIVHCPQSPIQSKGVGLLYGQDGGKEYGNLTRGEGTECSVMTVGLSYSGSNQVANDPDLSRLSSSGVGEAGLPARPISDNGRKFVSQSEGGKTDTLEPTVISSSGGSGSSLERTCVQSSGVNSHKRKGRDAEDSECQSGAPELESAAGDKPSQRTGSSRRSRAAEVHNLSERRRRDRINEKMRALQELIPHCNKTDKASMLDEAIEYLKSLQLQLQVMWMGGGMTPMMFPGVQHYMPRMGMGIGHPSLPSIHSTMHLPTVPLVDQSMPVAQSPNQAMMCQTPVLNPMNYQNQMQNAAFAEQYARLVGFHHMQTASQPINVFRFGPPTAQQSQTTATPGTGGAQFSGGTVTDDAAAGKSGG